MFREREMGSEKEGKPFSMPKSTPIHFPLRCLLHLLIFLPLCDSTSWAVKKKKGKGAVTMAAADQGKKCSPVHDKNMLLFGDSDCNVGQFITSLLFFPVSDIPRDSSLSSQAPALFLSRFI